jgi:hypothetical protein
VSHDRDVPPSFTLTREPGGPHMRQPVNTPSSRLKPNFILQQGFSEPKPESRSLQYASLRFQQRIIVVWALLAARAGPRPAEVLPVLRRHARPRLRPGRRRRARLGDVRPRRILPRRSRPPRVRGLLQRVSARVSLRRGAGPSLRAQ